MQDWLLPAGAELPAADQGSRREPRARWIDQCVVIVNSFRAGETRIAKLAESCSNCSAITGGTWLVRRRFRCAAAPADRRADPCGRWIADAPAAVGGGGDGARRIAAVMFSRTGRWRSGRCGGTALCAVPAGVAGPYRTAPHPSRTTAVGRCCGKAWSGLRSESGAGSSADGGMLIGPFPPGLEAAGVLAGENFASADLSTDAGSTPEKGTGRLAPRSIMLAENTTTEREKQ